ncbi:hypothetical protein INR49_000490 [Caranx melampygus]|nr:hypothetical protein INR49_000490 [Caranx melampygus]
MAAPTPSSYNNKLSPTTSIPGRHFTDSAYWPIALHLFGPAAYHTDRPLCSKMAAPSTPLNISSYLKA